MFTSPSSTCIQSFSNWHSALFFIIFYSRCGMEWDTGCRPTDDPFWAFFITWCAGASSTLKQYLFSLGSWKKKHILGIYPRKIIILGPFYSKAFVLLYKFETSRALLGRLSWEVLFFFAISAASNFKHSLFEFFQFFLAVSTTDKPVNRSIDAYALT